MLVSPSGHRSPTDVRRLAQQVSGTRNLGNHGVVQFCHPTYHPGQAILDTFLPSTFTLSHHGGELYDFGMAAVLFRIFLIFTSAWDGQGNGTDRDQIRPELPSDKTQEQDAALLYEWARV